MRRPAPQKALFAALLAATATTASAASPAAIAAPERDTLLELAECESYTEARLRETAERLSRERRWTYAHETLERETLQHERIVALADGAADSRFRRALVAAFFPEGVTSGDSETRVDRWTRCRRLYNRLSAER